MLSYAVLNTALFSPDLEGSPPSAFFFTPHTFTFTHYILYATASPANLLCHNVLENGPQSTLPSCFGCAVSFSVSKNNLLLHSWFK